MSVLSLPWPGWARGESWRSEMGGNRYRRRTVPIRSSILGKSSGPIRCPRLRTVGIRFAEGARPVEAMYEMLAACGYASLDDLRAGVKLPPGPRLVVPVRPGDASFPDANDASVLVEALILGLCAKTHYDPRRPVLWTEASLTRRLSLYDMGGFYALD